MKKLILILALVFTAAALPVAQTGCSSLSSASAQQTEVKTLQMLGTTAKAGIDASAQLLKQGQITVTQWNTISSFYDTKFQPAYALAVAAAHSDLSSVASPDLVTLGGQLAALVAQYATPTTH